MKSGSGTVQRAQQTDAALRAQTAQLQQGKAGLTAANKKIEVLSTQRAQAVAQLDRARAVEQQAALNLSYTQITAPVDGTVGARTLRVGQYVQAGTQLMAVVPLDAVYVVANFKETQLTHVRNGQPVELRVDSFHSTRLKGHVDSLSPASGLEFALLPPDNATGNFTKIVQRVPVKIVLDDQSLNGLLAPGHVGRADRQHQGRGGRRARSREARRVAQRQAPQLSDCERILLRMRRGTTMTTLQTTIDAIPASEDRPTAAAAPAVSAKTWLAVIGATLGAFMAVLNIQIVNASLADIQGGIGAGIDDGGWISTSYLIAEIVVIPLSGWLAQVFSVRIYLLTNAVLFLVFSAACALAQDLPQMIVLRAVQGFTGGVLIPMAFTLIITLLPKAKQPIGLALFAISATFAPAIGPTIGGYLTENFRLGIHLLRQRRARRDHDRHAVLLAGIDAHEAVAARGRRLAWHRHHGDRARRAADRARGRQQGRLVRLALHRSSCGDRRGRADAVRGD